MKNINIMKKRILVVGCAIALSLVSMTLNAQTFGNQKMLNYFGVADLRVGMLSSPAFVDIDNDGDTDLLVGEVTGTVKIFKNDGSNNFSFYGTLMSDGVIIDIVDFAAPVFADIDGDSDLDLYVGSNSGVINCYFNDGNGNFTHQGLLQVGGVNIDVGNWSKPVFRDMDNDNDLDLFVGSHEGFVFIYSNNGLGSFSFVDTLRSEGVVINGGVRVCPAFFDIDNDNDMDLYLGNYDGVIQIYTNDGAENFSFTANAQADGVNIQMTNNACPKFFDIDGDSDLDLFVGSMEGSINYYQNNGLGVFTSMGKVQSEGGYIFGEYILPVFEDMDGDSDLDLLVGGRLGSISLYSNDGTGKFFFQDFLKVGTVNINPGMYAAPAFADIDGDGDRDLYVGCITGVVKVYTNTGSGAYVSSGNLKAGGVDISVASISCPVFVDIDDDSDLDLVVGNSTGTLALYTNTNGEFTSVGNIQVGGVDLIAGGNAKPRFADLDGDDDYDLYVGVFDGTVKSYLNDGTGVFTANAAVLAFGVTIDAGTRVTPYFADVNGVCGQDLYIGEQGGTIVYYINDVTAPVITTVMEDQVINTLEYCSALLPDYTTGITATDNCNTNFEITQSPAAGTEISHSSNMVTITVRDDANNEDQIVFYVSVHDVTSPVITSTHNDKIIANEGNCQATLPDYRNDLTFTDNCSGDWNVYQIPNYGTVISGNMNTVTLKIYDAADNFSEVSFNVAVSDDTNPEITSVHNDKTLEAVSNCEAILPDYTSELIATDNCDANPEFSQSPIAGTAISGAVNTISLIVTDSYGNHSNVEFNVAVEDNSNPVITSTHNEQTIEAVANCEVALPDYTSDVIANDNCDSDLLISQLPIAGSLVSGISNNVTLTVTDGTGNFSEVSFNVVVEDNTNPTVSCVEDYVVNLSEGQNTYTVSESEFNLATVEDNCGIATIINDFNNSTTLDGAELPIGNNTIEWTVTDLNGNINTCSFDVTVNVFVGVSGFVSNSIEVYPNPAHNQIQIVNVSNSEISISDVCGKVIYKSAKSSANAQVIDISDFTQGVYFVTVKNDNYQTTIRIIKN